MHTKPFIDFGYISVLSMPMNKMFISINPFAFWYQSNINN